MHLGYISPSERHSAEGRTNEQNQQDEYHTARKGKCCVFQDKGLGVVALHGHTKFPKNRYFLDATEISTPKK